MTTPSGPGPSNDPYGSAGQYPTGGSGGYPPPGGYPSAGQHQQPGGYQQPGQYAGQYPAGPAGQYPTGGQYPAAGAYGQPGYGAPTGGGRPGIATAAAVLAFIFGAGAIIQSLFGIIIGSLFSGASNSTSSIVNSGVSIVCDTTLPGYDAADCDQARASADVVNNAAGSIGTFGIILGIGAAIVAVLMIWGGVVLLSGKNSQMVVIAAGIYFVVAIALMIATSFGFFYIFGLVLPVLIVVFAMNSSTKAWVKSKGGKTF